MAEEKQAVKTFAQIENEAAEQLNTFVIFVSVIGFGKLLPSSMRDTWRWLRLSRGSCWRGKSRYGTCKKPDV